MIPDFLDETAAGKILCNGLKSGRLAVAPQGKNQNKTNGYKVGKSGEFPCLI
jgi:hypothetical protein